MTTDPAEHRRIRVLVVDDHVVVRSGLEQLLATTDDIELVGDRSERQRGDRRRRGACTPTSC